MRQPISISTLIFSVLLGSVVFLLLFPVSAHGAQCIGGTLFEDGGGPAILDDDGNPQPCEGDFSSEGLFGCNKTGAEAMSVGSISVLSSSYVPVDDAAVRLNTGYLVYKECFADGIFRNMAESVTARRTAEGLMSFLTGRVADDGTLHPLFPTDLRADVVALANESVLHTAQSGQLTTINPAFQGDVTRTVLRNHMAKTYASNKDLACPYAGDLDAVLQGTTNDVWGGLTALMNPACNPLGAYQLAKQYVDTQKSQQINEQLFRLQAGGGVYDVREYNPETGRYETLTPGSLVGANVQQLLTSGFRQLENATEIEQIVGALFSGLSSHVIKDGRGLVGIIESSTGQSSYLDQLILQSTDKFLNNVKKAAKKAYDTGLKIEELYLEAATDTASILETTVDDLREAEYTCLEEIYCTAKPPAGASVTCELKPELGGGQLVLTTEAGLPQRPSQQIIDARIAPIVDSITQAIEVGTKAVEILTDIQKKMDDKNTSKDEARTALVQLESLVAQDVIHTSAELKDIKKYKEEVGAAMKELVDDTAEEWTTGNGWCNPANATEWVGKWK
ncbi:hypothetical protein C4585_02810 [Candidatus Parcubacteria bacterium]|nr:MAG: hypothetical protein C4585_02810 [Candidatus Parcubacteria bacterium]